MLWLRSLQVTISESWCCESLVMSETSEPKDTAPPLLSGEQRSYDPNHVEHWHAAPRTRPLLMARNSFCCCDRFSPPLVPSAGSPVAPVELARRVRFAWL